MVVFAISGSAESGGIPMKRFFAASTQLAFLMASAAIGALAYQGDTPARSTASPLGHAPVQVRRNDDGSIERGRNGQIATENWSGYAVAQFETHQTYTAAQATWTVPAVQFDPNDTSGLSTQYSATWVGIGGFCENATCNKGDHTLIQLGTEQDVSSDGTTSYSSWYELLPAFPVTKDPKTYPVAPGDVITASLQCTSCSSKKQFWTLTMSNLGKWRWMAQVTYASSKLSAEWIAEAPSAGGILPLANFGTAHFTDLDVGSNESPPSLTLETNGILLEDPNGQTADVSDPNADAFNACWGFMTFTACPMP